MCYESQESNTHEVSSKEFLSVMLWRSVYLYYIAILHIIDAYKFLIIVEIYLNYWGKKHWKCLLCDKDAKANINSLELKLVKLSS